jgi:AraC family transcriptional regulator of adaptative response/methylated-DNA-[protein]-cysteine methyltransferase
MTFHGMITNAVPSRTEMLRAFTERDASYDGLFLTAVKTTGIFCRPTCTARKPRPENVEFYATAREALFAGYRPCRRCQPIRPPGATPDWLAPILAEIERAPDVRIRDADLRRRGLTPETVRRWFRREHGMTFQAYQRARRMGRALDALRRGENVTATAFDTGFESLSGFNSAFARFAGASPGKSRDAAPVSVRRLLSPLGPLVVAATEDALVMLEFADRRMLEKQIDTLARRIGALAVPRSNRILEQTEDELTRYFEGALRTFTIPLFAPGTPFQEAVWRALLTIPYAETRSYLEQARIVGRPTATRAVARANGDNRIAIIIPCHRVVGADGRLTGYGGGLWRKKYLLDMEQKTAGIAQLEADLT